MGTLTASTQATSATDIRDDLVDTLRRDLIGPGPHDADLATELLTERPSRWYLTGFIAPEIGDSSSDDVDNAEQGLLGEGADGEGEPPPDPVMGGRSEDNGDPDPAAGGRRLQPTSLGLTVLLQTDVAGIEAVVSWGDYQAEPPLPPEVLSDDSERPSSELRWRRLPRRVGIRVTVPPDGRPAAEILVPDSASPQLGGGGLTLACHARSYPVKQPDGSTMMVRALTVILVNRRRRPRPLLPRCRLHFPGKIGTALRTRFRAAMRPIRSLERRSRPAARRSALSRRRRICSRPRDECWMGARIGYGPSCMD